MSPEELSKVGDTIQSFLPSHTFIPASWGGPSAPEGPADEKKASEEEGGQEVGADDDSWSLDSLKGREVRILDLPLPPF